MSELVLYAPLRGIFVSLDEVEDPVFAEGMIGAGGALDPLEGLVRAPCAGRILSVHAAGHAVAMRAENGAELLVHVGVDTVRLEGRGFAAHVGAGAQVALGDPLLSFDLDGLAQDARSLLIPLVVTNGDLFGVRIVRPFGPVDALDALLSVAPLDAAAAAAAPPPARVRRALKVAATHGLHARPAARITRSLDGLDAEVTLIHQGRRADARSVVDILVLGAGEGVTLEAEASGVDAEAAIAAVARVVETNDAGPGDTEPPAARDTGRAAPEVRDPPGVLRGRPAAPGIAVGRVAWFTAPAAPHETVAAHSAGEGPALRGAFEAVRAELQRALAATPAAGRAPDDPRRDILRAHLAIAADPALMAAAAAEVDAGAHAGTAVARAVAARGAALWGLGDARFAARAADLEDVGRRLVRALSGETSPAALPQSGAVVLATELLPSDVLALEACAPAGICTADGGATSHAAVLAAAMGLPMVVGVGPGLSDAVEGARVVLDADEGLFHLRPSAEELARAVLKIDGRQARRRAATAQAREACRTRDGTGVEILATLGSVAEARAAAAAGADGCGLVRTEFLFEGRREPPEEDEQRALYQDIADVLGHGPLVIRTLDVGADKPASFLPLRPEENPALGMRGVRVSLEDPALLDVQLRALARVNAGARLRIMVPMVTERAELDAVRQRLDLARERVGALQAAPLGAMIETPAAAVSLDLLAPSADFFSIGANDLSQYVLAMDRGHRTLSARLDGLHPAVLRTIGLICTAAAAAGRPLALCGALAADPLASGLLLGLGVRTLSVPPGAVAEAKARFRRLDVETCRALATAALACASAAAVRALVADRLPGDPA